MEKVTVNLTEPKNNKEVPMTLHNGDIVLKMEDGKIKGTYLVTSYRNGAKSNYENMNYCSLVDLATGFLAFEERCSRTTTNVRILKHLYNKYDEKCSYRDIEIKILKHSEYNIVINKTI